MVSFFVIKTIRFGSMSTNSETSFLVSLLENCTIAISGILVGVTTSMMVERWQELKEAEHELAKKRLDLQQEKETVTRLNETVTHNEGLGNAQLASVMNNPNIGIKFVRFQATQTDSAITLFTNNNNNKQ
jgi:hypothetical protein